MLKSQGVEKIIAIDVGSEDNNDLTNYGDHISGWYILWNKLNPFAEKLRVSGSTLFLHDQLYIDDCFYPDSQFV